MTQNGLVSPHIVDLHVRAAGEYQPHAVRAFSGAKNGGALSVLPFIPAEAVQHGLDLRRIRAAKQRGMRQKRIMHHFYFSLS